MKKLIAFCIAAMMMAAPACAGEAADYTGDWYGNFMGAVMKMTINENGTYEMIFAGELQEGTWELTDDGIQVDDDATGVLTEEGLEITGEDEMTMVFGRDELEDFVPAEIDYEADLDALQGKWSAYKFGAGGAYMDLAPEDMSYMEMEITDTTAKLNGFYFEDAVIELEMQDGGLSKHFDDEGEMFEIMAVNLLKDGTLRLALVSSIEEDDQMEYLFVPAEETESMTEI